MLSGLPGRSLDAIKEKHEVDLVAGWMGALDVPPASSSTVTLTASGAVRDAGGPTVSAPPEGGP